MMSVSPVSPGHRVNLPRHVLGASGAARRHRGDGAAELREADHAVIRHVGALGDGDALEALAADAFVFFGTAAEERWARDAFLRFSDGGLISGAAVLEFVEGSTYAEACHQHEFEHAWAEADRHQRGALDDVGHVRAERRRDVRRPRAHEVLVVAARLDNLGKGASGAAVQNLNIARGLDEAIARCAAFEELGADVVYGAFAACVVY